MVITTTDGRQFSAKFVVITLPIGYLQKNMGSLFSPALPAAKAAAINSMVRINARMRECRYTLTCREPWAPLH